MEISQRDGEIVIARLDIFLVELLRQIAGAADPQGSQQARARLLSPPSSEEKFNEDWKSYVEPSLQHLFKSSLDTIKDDLGKMEPADGDSGVEYAVRIPTLHADAWLNGLNQARLVIAARHALTEKDMEMNASRSLLTVRDLALFQVHFYGFLQECFLRELD